MGVEERTSDYGSNSKAARVATTIAGLSVIATLIMPCATSERDTLVRDEASPAGIAEQQTMNSYDRFEPAIYIGPTIREYDGGREEAATPQRTGKNPWFYLRP